MLRFLLAALLLLAVGTAGGACGGSGNNPQPSGLGY
jgi:hypothetical protein